MNKEALQNLKYYLNGIHHIDHDDWYNEYNKLLDLVKKTAILEEIAKEQQEQVSEQTARAMILSALGGGVLPIESITIKAWKQAGFIKQNTPDTEQVSEQTALEKAREIKNYTLDFIRDKTTKKYVEDMSKYYEQHIAHLEQQLQGEP